MRLRLWKRKCLTLSVTGNGHEGELVAVDFTLHQIPQRVDCLTGKHCWLWLFGQKSSAQPEPHKVHECGSRSWRWLQQVWIDAVIVHRAMLSVPSQFTVGMQCIDFNR